VILDRAGASELAQMSGFGPYFTARKRRGPFRRVTAVSATDECITINQRERTPMKQANSFTPTKTAPRF
jgi:hypothetical protein